MHQLTDSHPEGRANIGDKKPADSRRDRNPCYRRRIYSMYDLFTETSIPYLTRIAENSSMPPSMLEQLALHQDPDVREAVTDNINTPIDTLWLLSHDECADVRYAMAENHNLPLPILSSLMADENPYVATRASSTVDRVIMKRTSGAQLLFGLGPDNLTECAG